MCPSVAGTRYAPAAPPCGQRNCSKGGRRSLGQWAGNTSNKYRKLHNLTTTLRVINCRFSSAAERLKTPSPDLYDHEILGPTWRRTARPTAVNRCTIAVINSAAGTEAPSPRAPRHRTSLKPLSRPRTHWQPSARLKVALHCSFTLVIE